jgi:flavin reductase (DIM6/NTAB) family NADH-FMN oxidoreductase RutF
VVIVEKDQLRVNRFFLPGMPVVLVGAMVDGRANFMTVAFVGQVNFSPPMLGISIGDHATRDAILKTRQFSVNVPSRGLLKRVDLMGLVSGRERDKSKVFNVSFGRLPMAPFAEECPVNVGLTVKHTLELPGDVLFVGLVEEVLVDRQALYQDGLVDVSKVDPFFLSMPDNIYWSLGGQCGAAWHDGLPLRDSVPGL